MRTNAQAAWPRLKACESCGKRLDPSLINRGNRYCSPECAAARIKVCECDNRWKLDEDEDLPERCLRCGGRTEAVVV